MIHALEQREALDSKHAGAKAARLAALHQASFPTPGGLVLSIDAMGSLFEGAGVAARWSNLRSAVEAGDWDQAEALAGEAREALLGSVITGEPRSVVARALENAGLSTAPCAVRSSGIAEDLAGASFAGQFETVLGAQGVDAVLGAVLRCAASFVAPQAMAYRRTQDLRSIDGAVLVQRLVRAQAAGVAFTVDPRDGSTEQVVIEAVRGLGDALVSGKTTPDRFFVAREGRTVQLEARPRTGAPAIDSAAAQRIAALALDTEKNLGHPVDIEWAIEDGAVFLLQARPVTAVARSRPPAGWVPEFQTTVDPRYPRYTRGNIGEVVPGCVSPLGWSMMVPVLEHAFRSFSGATHTLPPLGPEPTIVGTFYRRLYLNVSVFLAMADAAPGASRAEVLEELVGVVDEPVSPRPWWKGLAPSRMVHNARVIGSAISLVRREEADLAAVEADLQAKAERLRADPPNLWPLEKFASEDLLVARTSDVTSLHIRLSNGATSSYRRLKSLCAKHLADKDGALAAQLVAGIGELGRDDPAQGLFDLAGRAAASPSLDALFGNEPDDACVLAKVRAADAPTEWQEFAKALAKFLDAHGHRGLAEVDIATPTWRQDPRQVLRLIRAQRVAGGESPAVRVERQRVASEELRARVLAGLSFGARLAMRDAIDRARSYIRLRERTKDLALRFTALSREILWSLADKLVAAKLLEARDDLFMLLRDEAVAAALGKLSAVELATRLERRRREQGWCEAVTLPKVFDGAIRPLAPGEVVVSEGALRGVPVCGGVVEGPARVLRELRECEALVPGEIMVASVTDLAWTPYFLRVRGLVVEVGGLLSHGSIVAREYGLPTVVGVADATRRIHTGDRIRVDANAGVVEVLSSASESRT